MKRGQLVFAITLLLLLITNVLAQTSGLQDDEILENIEKGQDTFDEFSEQESKSTYLANEWTKFLQKSPATSWIYKLNPIFRFLFGYEFSLSWAFFTALFLFILILSIYYPTTKLMIKETFTSLGISILVAVITANLITEPIINSLAKVASNIWWVLGIEGVLLFLIILVGIIFRNFSRYLKKKKTQKRIRKLESEAGKTQEELGEYEAIKEGAEAMKEGSE